MAQEGQERGSYQAKRPIQRAQQKCRFLLWPLLKARINGRSSARPRGPPIMKGMLRAYELAILPSASNVSSAQAASPRSNAKRPPHGPLPPRERWSQPSTMVRLCGAMPRWRGHSGHPQLLQLGLFDLLELCLIFEVVRDEFEPAVIDPCVEEVAGVATDSLRAADTHQWHEHQDGAYGGVPAHEHEMSSLQVDSSSQLELVEDTIGPAKSLGLGIDMEAPSVPSLVDPGEVDVIEPGRQRLLGFAQQHLEGGNPALCLRSGLITPPWTRVLRTLRA